MNVRVLNHGGELWLNVEEARHEIHNNKTLALEACGLVRVGYDRGDDLATILAVVAGHYLMTLARVGDAPVAVTDAGEE